MVAALQRGAAPVVLRGDRRRRHLRRRLDQMLDGRRGAAAALLSVGKGRGEAAKMKSALQLLVELCRASKLEHNLFVAFQN